ncbi:uncharacterized protein [Setaria viridis]|uniref:uncharacterized protein n=1 Tax=Setaria viridis TaxID=4556 RepID=UPI003B3B3AE1
MWRAHILAAVHGSRLVDHLTGAILAPAQEIDGKDAAGKDAKLPNPAFDEWYVRDQEVLSFIFSSLAQDVMSHVSAMETTAELWSAIEVMYSSRTSSRAVNTCVTLATAQKGNQTVAEFVSKMRSLGDEMATTGRPLEEELVEYILMGLDFDFILMGLDFDFNPIVSVLLVQKGSISIEEFYSQLLAFETPMELLGTGSSKSSANMANWGGRGGNGGRGHGNPGRGCGSSSSTPNNNANSNNNFCQGGGSHGNNNFSHGNNNSHPLCQVCLKVGHTADCCWHRYGEDYVTKERHVAAAVASASYNIDTNWYTDPGATNHITGELEKLAFRDKSNRTDQVHTVSGTSMNISHVGKSIIHSHVS